MIVKDGAIFTIAWNLWNVKFFIQLEIPIIIQYFHADICKVGKQKVVQLAAVAQWYTPQPFVPKVRGSNPTQAFFSCSFLFTFFSQVFDKLGQAPVLSGGHGTYVALTSWGKPQYCQVAMVRTSHAQKFSVKSGRSHINLLSYLF